MKKLLALILLLSFSIKSQEVIIGTQTWTSKNLDVETYRNGDVIHQVQDATVWNKLTTGAWCYYETDTAHGKLYNWYAVNDARGLAPKGYHIPSSAEWTTLTDYLGGKLEGIKLQSTEGWEGCTATNSSGFAGFPRGRRDRYGIFEGGELKDGHGKTASFGFYGYWWSSSSAKYSSEHANYRSLNYRGELYSNNEFNRCGFSIRCIKD